MLGGGDEQRGLSIHTTDRSTEVEATVLARSPTRDLRQREVAEASAALREAEAARTADEQDQCAVDRFTERRHTTGQTL
jgi:hypothetical protein